MTSAERHEVRYQRRKAQRQAKRQLLLDNCDNYDKVFTYEHLYRSYLQCRKGVRWKASIQLFESNAVYNVYILYKQLQNGTFRSRGFHTFDKYDRGKLRHISSVDIWERVVQRCLCDYCLVPILEKTFIYDNSATRKNKGIRFCVERVAKQFQEMYNKYGFDFYVAVFDYTKYFESINHKILIDMLSKYIHDARLLNLTAYFINCFDGEAGLGLGSQVSQVSALLYVSDIDHYIQEQTKTEKYHRYMDDKELMSQSKEYLQEIAKYLDSQSTNRHLLHNQKKTQFIKANKGFKFLKFWFHIENGRVRRKPQRSYFTKMRRKIRHFSQKYSQGKMSLADVEESMQSWQAYSIHIAKYPKAINYTKRYFEKYFAPRGEEVLV